MKLYFTYSYYYYYYYYNHFNVRKDIAGRNTTAEPFYFVQFILDYFSWNY